MEFQPADETQWRALLAAAEHNADGGEVGALTWKTFESIQIAPLSGSRVRQLEEAR